MQAARDERILEKAFEENRIIVSADSDFGTLLARLNASRPSFILFREANLIRAEDYANLLLPNLYLVPMLPIGRSRQSSPQPRVAVVSSKGREFGCLARIPCTSSAVI